MTTTRYLDRDWLCNTRDAPSGAQAKLLENVKGEPHVYLQIDTNHGRRYGVMPGDELADFASFNRHAYEMCRRP